MSARGSASPVELEERRRRRVWGWIKFTAACLASALALHEVLAEEEDDEPGERAGETIHVSSCGNADCKTCYPPETCDHKNVMASPTETRCRDCRKILEVA